MREYTIFEFKLYFKDPKNKFMYLSVFCFLLGILVYIPYQNLGSINEKTQTELSLVRDTISSFPVHIVQDNPDTYPVYREILRESQLLAQQEVSLTFYDDLNQYMLAGFELSDTRIKAHEIGFEGVSSSFLIPLEQSKRERVLYRYLIDHNIEIERNAENSSSYLIVATTFFSSVFFVFIFLLSGDILTKDLEHKSLIQSFPLDNNKKVLCKLIVHTIMTLLLLIGIFVLVYVIASMVFGGGSMDYPRVMFTSSGYIAVPTILYLFNYFVLATIFLIHTILLVTLINCFLKNRYLTLFAGSSLYLISFLFSDSISILEYTPLNYLNPSSVLDGLSAQNYGQDSNTIYRAIIVLITWSLIYIITLSLYYSRQNRKIWREIREGRSK